MILTLVVTVAPWWSDSFLANNLFGLVAAVSPLWRRGDCLGDFLGVSLSLFLFLGIFLYPYSDLNIVQLTAYACLNLGDREYTPTMQGMIFQRCIVFRNVIADILNAAIDQILIKD